MNVADRTRMRRNVQGAVTFTRACRFSKSIEQTAIIPAGIRECMCEVETRVRECLHVFHEFVAWRDFCFSTARNSLVVQVPCRSPRESRRQQRKKAASLVGHRWLAKA